MLYIKIRFYSSVACLYTVTLLFVCGALGVLPAGDRPGQTVQAAAPIQQAELPKLAAIISGKPVRMVVPRLAIDLPILDGDYNENTGEWTLGETSAYYATPSFPANDFHGNTLIYGHNFKSIFGRLKNLQEGDTMQVTTNNGHIFTYIYEKHSVFDPTDISVFGSTGYPQVVLQTCTGNWNEYRQMFYFNLDEVNG